MDTYMLRRGGSGDYYDDSDDIYDYGSDWSFNSIIYYYFFISY